MKSLHVGSSLQCRLCNSVIDHDEDEDDNWRVGMNCQFPVGVRNLEHKSRGTSIWNGTWPTTSSLWDVEIDGPL